MTMFTKVFAIFLLTTSIVVVSANKAVQECSKLCADLKRKENVDMTICKAAENVAPRPAVHKACLTGSRLGFSDACLPLCKGMKPKSIASLACSRKRYTGLAEVNCQRGYEASFLFGSKIDIEVTDDEPIRSARSTSSTPERMPNIHRSNIVSVDNNDNPTLIQEDLTKLKPVSAKKIHRQPSMAPEKRVLENSLDRKWSEKRNLTNHNITIFEGYSGNATVKTKSETSPLIVDKSPGINHKTLVPKLVKDVTFPSDLKHNEQANIGRIREDKLSPLVPVRNSVDQTPMYRQIETGKEHGTFKFETSINEEKSFQRNNSVLKPRLYYPDTNQENNSTLVNSDLSNHPVNVKDNIKEESGPSINYNTGMNSKVYSLPSDGNKLQSKQTSMVQNKNEL